jgi:hypothetical protein
VWADGQPLRGVHLLPQAAELRLCSEPELRRQLHADESSPQLLARRLWPVVGVGCAVCAVWCLDRGEISATFGASANSHVWQVVLLWQAAIASLGEAVVLIFVACRGDAIRKRGLLSLMMATDAVTAALTWLPATQCTDLRTVETLLIADSDSGSGSGEYAPNVSVVVLEHTEGPSFATFFCWVNGTAARREFASGYALDTSHLDTAALTSLRGLSLLVLLQMLTASPTHANRLTMFAAVYLVSCAVMVGKGLLWVGNSPESESWILFVGVALGLLEASVCLLASRRLRRIHAASQYHLQISGARSLALVGTHCRCTSPPDLILGMQC